MFSPVASRLAGTTDPLHKLRAELEARGESVVDLISGNVTEHGITFPQPLLEEILVEATRRCQIYRPDSFGQETARKAIASYYQEHGVSLAPNHVLLTPGSSISYWYCFKLLAAEGEEVLCPRPSYPLFDYIAALSGIRMVPYLLRATGRWRIDLDDLENRISTRSRAVILISPHNPTGHVASAEEIQGMAEIARRHELAIISDEVFSEFVFEERRLPRPAASTAPLVFTLNGFSKMFALPGLKLGWMAVSGEEAKVRQALRALELISDTFLPVNEPAQAAVASIFDRGQAFQESYVSEIHKRCRIATEFLSKCPKTRMIAPEGGFYVTLQLEGIEEEPAAQAILLRKKILVHSGYHYDIAPHHLVLSFAQKPEVLRKALAGVADVLEGS